MNYHKNRNVAAALQTEEPQRGNCSFYRCIVECVLTSCTNRCSVLNRKSLQREVKAARHSSKASMEDPYVQRCRKRANKIITDPQHQSSRLFHLLPSGGRYHQTQEQFTSRGNTTNELSGHEHALTIVCTSHCFNHHFFSMDLTFISSFCSRDFK